MVDEFAEQAVEAQRRVEGLVHVPLDQPLQQFRLGSRAEFAHTETNRDLPSPSR